MNSDRAVSAYIALGANLGNPLSTLQQAIIELGRLPDSSLVKSSSFYRTAHIGAVETKIVGTLPDYINAVALLQTTLSPSYLLSKLLTIEKIFGRQRSVRNAPRLLDLDLLLYGGREMNDGNLILPHPRMHQRAFVLVPLAEIAPTITIPGLGELAPYLAACSEQKIARITT